MNQQIKLYRISQLLSRFSEQVKILNSNSEFSINIHAENILIKMLNTLYNCNLKNVNYEENKVYPSIDLRDCKSRIAVQVTSTSKLEKIKHTLSEFLNKNIYKEFDVLYIYIITNKQNKYSQEKIDELLGEKFQFPVSNIIDNCDVYKELNSQNNSDKINVILNLLEEQFADKQKFDKWDTYCKGLFEYDKYIVNFYEYLDIKGFSPKINNSLVRLTLDSIYVPLTFRIDSATSNKSIPEQPIVFDIFKAIETFNRLVILGDPGSGKSTVLKHLAYMLCRNRPTNNQYNKYVPVYIKASEFAKASYDSGKNLSDYIIDGYNQKYSKLFSDSLDNDSLLLLLDGLDEISITNQRHYVVEQVNSFVAQYPDIKTIVSSRIVGYNETRLGGSFSHFEVNKFNQYQIFDFIKNWYQSISECSDNDSESVADQAKELYSSIRKNNSVYQLATNPLLLTIIALIYYQGSSLPEKRAALYDIATSTFLDNWVKLRVQQKKYNVDREILIEILAPLAFFIHKNFTTGLLPEKDLRTQLSIEYQKIYPHLNQKELKEEINSIVDFLREEAGFLFEKGRDENGNPLFGFVHQTFQEYFAAIELQTRWKEGTLTDDLKTYVYNSNWLEVIKLSASLFKLQEPSRRGRSNASNFVKDILCINEQLPEMQRRLVVVSQILRDGVEVEFPVFDIIVNELLGLLAVEGKRPVTMSGFNVARISLRDLLSQGYYMQYLVARISDIVVSKPISPLTKNLIYVLMDSSNVELVKDCLQNILRSEDVELKEIVFNHSVVMPVAEIVKTELFKDEIVKYVNSPFYALKYDEHLPIQYVCCFNESVDEWLHSIRMLTSYKMKEDLINFYVFSWGMGDVNNVIRYYSLVKQEYPEMDCSKIETYIAEQERFNAYGLDRYPIATLNGTQIHRKIDEDKYAIVNGEVVTFCDYPFSCREFEQHFADEAHSYIDFLSKVISAMNSQSNEMEVGSVEDLLNIIRYEYTLHWTSKVKWNDVISYAINVCLNKGIYDSFILQWLKNKLMEWEYRNIAYHGIEMEDMVMSSTLHSYEKLLILNAIYPNRDYVDLIRMVIDEYKTESSEDCRSEMYKVIYKVL